MLENIFFYVGHTHCIDCSDRNTIGAHIIQIDDDELHCTALYRGMCIANVIDAKLEYTNCKEARKKNDCEMCHRRTHKELQLLK